MSWDVTAEEISDWKQLWKEAEKKAKRRFVLDRYAERLKKHGTDSNKFPFPDFMQMMNGLEPETTSWRDAFTDKELSVPTIPEY